MTHPFTQLAIDMNLAKGNIVDVQDITGGWSRRVAVENCWVTEAAGIIGAAFSDEDGHRISHPWSSIACIILIEEAK